MKRLLSFITILLCSVAMWAQTFTVDGIKYKVTSTTVLTVEVTSGGDYSGDIVIPEKVEYNDLDYSVTSIGSDAFRNCSGLTSITIPNSVTSIGSSAFYKCSGLTSITIPNSVTCIGDWAFGYCPYLASIVVDSGNTVYDSRENCNAIIETSSNTLHTGCKNTVIPNSVTSIGDRAFYSCHGLTSITIPNSVTSIGDWAFCGCDLTSITIPNSVTTIGEQAFSNCSCLTSLIIPNGVTSIGDWAFGFCDCLTFITIPNSVTTIGEQAFVGINGSVIVESETPLALTSFPFNPIGDDNNHLTLFVPKGCKTAYEEASYWNEFPRILEIPDPSSTNIAFADANVKALCVANWDFNRDGELSESEAVLVTSLGKVFQKTDITSFEEFPYFTNLIFIDISAFWGCSGLTSITIPNNVTSIGGGAFWDCSSLTSITIPNSVTSIGWGAFSGCNGLTSIVVENGNSVYDSRDNCNAIIETNSNTLHTGCKNTVIPNSVTSIGESAFFKCTGLASVTIGNSVTSIGRHAFLGCTGLTSVEIPNSVTSIGESAFYDCSGLTSVTIGNGVTSIGESAFFKCTGLASVTIGNSVTSIDGFAFYGCSGLTSIQVESGNITYDSRNNCNAIIETATNTLITGCMNTVIPNSVTSISLYAFAGCTGLTSVEIPNSVTSISPFAFKGCSGLTSVTIGNSVTSIGYEAFAGCYSLISVLAEMETPVEIEEWTFENRANATLYVPAGCKKAYEAANYWKDFKEIIEMDIQPIDTGETVDFGSDIDGDTDLDGNIVGDIYYVISNDDGGYDVAEGCIVVTTPTDDSTIDGQDIFGEDFQNNYTGIVLKVPAGRGTITVEAQTIGTMVLKVKIGTAAPVTMELDGRLKVSFPYDVTEPTYVYIYGGSNASAAPDMAGSTAGGELKLYGIEVAPGATGIEPIDHSTLNIEHYYTLDGRMLQGEPTQKGVYIVNGHKVAIK